MKNLFEVLRQKQSDLQQVQREVEALRIAERLLAEDGDADATSITASPTAVKPLAYGTGGIRQFP